MAELPKEIKVKFTFDSTELEDMIEKFVEEIMIPKIRECIARGIKIE